MSETTTPENAQNPTATDQEGSESTTPDPRNAEAAQWRRKLRDAEAELDQVRAERDALQAQISDGRAAKVRSALTDELRGLREDAVETLVGAADPEKFLDEDGEIDAEAVEKYTAPFTASLGPGPRDKRGWVTGARAESAPGVAREPSWGSVVQNG